MLMNSGQNPKNLVRMGNYLKLLDMFFDNFRCNGSSMGRIRMGMDFYSCRVFCFWQKWKLLIASSSYIITSDHIRYFTYFTFGNLVFHISQRYFF